MTIAFLLYGITRLAGWVIQGSGPNMMLRHWHPAKIGIIWILDLALLLLLWKPCRSGGGGGLEPYGGWPCSHTQEILLWLVFSIPAIVFTWIWASTRERPNSVQPTGATSEESHVAPQPSNEMLPHPVFEKVTADQARSLAIRSLKKRKVLRIRLHDGREQGISVAEDMGTFCRAFRKHGENTDTAGGYDWIDYREIAEMLLTDMDSWGTPKGQ